MKINEKMLDFYRFDGEGSGEAGAANASNESQGSQQTVKPEIVYGKSPKGEASASQVGSDKGAQEEDLGAEFAALIGKGGKYHDAYGQMVSQAIQDRFKNQADLNAQLDGVNNALMPMFMNYGLEVGDIDGLADAIANDEDWLKAGAERAGITPQQYRENLDLRAKADRGERIREHFEQEQQLRRQYEQHEAEAQQLRQAIPNFDLGREMESNERFTALLRNNCSVPEAFFATHAQELLSGSMQEASQMGAQKVMDNIQRRTSRPVESAMNGGPAIEVRSDPSKYTDADIDEINRRVANGEVVFL